MKSMVVSSSSRRMSCANAGDVGLLDQINQVNQKEAKESQHTLAKEPLTARTVGRSSRQGKMHNKTVASSVIATASSNMGQSQRVTGSRVKRSSSRNSRNINQSILELVKNKDAFNNQFDESVKRKTLTVNKTHVFDSRQTVITVGQNNVRYPFDTEDSIFLLFESNPACQKAQGQKIKHALVQQENCGVCRKPKDTFKKKIGQCEFCATYGCPDCMLQSFPFPQLDPQDKTRNFGVCCITCEAKLHINTVTSDILRALAKAEFRTEARERRIQQVANDQSIAENYVALQKRRLQEQIDENTLKTDSVKFKISQQQSRVTKCEEDNKQIQRHIDLRRMEKENKDDQIKQLKKQIEIAKRQIEINKQDLLRVNDDMIMLKRQVKVRPSIQPHQHGMSNITQMTSSVDVSANCSHLDINYPSEVDVQDQDPVFGQGNAMYASHDTYQNHDSSESNFFNETSYSGTEMYENNTLSTSFSSGKRRKGKKILNKHTNEGKACCKTDCNIF